MTQTAIAQNFQDCSYLRQSALICVLKSSQVHTLGFRFGARADVLVKECQRALPGIL